MLHELNRLDEAIEAYAVAADTLDAVRHEISLGYGNGVGGGSFQDEVGSLYYEWADLLLQRAVTARDTQLKRRDLVNAQAAIERYKTAELNDYFQQDCVEWLGSHRSSTQTVPPHTVVIYPVLLPDRTELLLSFTDDIVQVTIPVGRDELSQTASKFRFELENLSTQIHLAQAQQLYRWLIAPIKDLLDEREVTTEVWGPRRAVAPRADGCVTRWNEVPRGTSFQCRDPRPNPAQRFGAVSGGPPDAPTAFGLWIISLAPGQIWHR